MIIMYTVLLLLTHFLLKGLSIGLVEVAHPGGCIFGCSFHVVLRLVSPFMA